MTVLDSLRAAARLGWLLLARAWLPAPAQLPGRAPAPAQAASAAVLHDPLDRETPRRAISAFARAAQRGDLVLASRYAQGGHNRPQARIEVLVGRLAQLMNRYFHQPTSSISDAPEGSLVDGLPLDRERLGPLRVGTREESIELVRVTDPVAGPIWLISADTLARIGALDDEDTVTLPERLLPEPLFKRAFFDFTYADLLLWAASFVLPMLLLPPLFRFGHALVRRFLPARAEAVYAWYRGTRAPVVVFLALLAHLAALTWFGPTLSFRILYGRFIVVLLVAVLAWGLKRAFSVFFGRTGAQLQDRGRTGVRSVMLLGERLLNVLLLLVAVLVVLAVVGFDMKTVLAGLGIIGVALALGAQKTIENILGGMMLLADEAIAVGDLCRINNRLGTVEDITLRSVRFRTVEHTLLSIPAGVLAQAELENFATRGKILAHHRLRLAYDTSAQQLRRIRARMAALIEADPALEHPLSRVHIVEFGPGGIEVEIYGYVLTHDVPRFLIVREDLLLQAIAIVEDEGARFAPPAPWAPATPAAAADPPR